MIDLLHELSRAHRAVAAERGGDDEDLIAVSVTRTYDTHREDLWSALTDRERLARWFIPVTGDLRLSGTFQLEGNAGGEILACDAPALLRLSYGGASSIVTITLAASDSGSTELTLHHTVPLAMAGSVAGALYVGPGWDAGLISLVREVAGEVTMNAIEFGETTEGRDVARHSVDLWAEAVTAGGASAEETAGARTAALGQFAPAESD